MLQEARELIEHYDQNFIEKAATHRHEGQYRADRVTAYEHEIPSSANEIDGDAGESSGRTPNTARPNSSCVIQYDIFQGSPTRHAENGSDKKTLIPKPQKDFGRGRKAASRSPSPAKARKLDYSGEGMWFTDANVNTPEEWLIEQTEETYAATNPIYKKHIAPTKPQNASQGALTLSYSGPTILTRLDDSDAHGETTGARDVTNEYPAVHDMPLKQYPDSSSRKNTVSKSTQTSPIALNPHLLPSQHPVSQNAMHSAENAALFDQVRMLRRTMEAQKAEIAATRRGMQAMKDAKEGREAREKRELEEALLQSEKWRLEAERLAAASRAGRDQ